MFQEAVANLQMSRLVFFRASLFLDRVCALLRNDSISDLTQRSNLYGPLFKYLEIIANDPILVQLLFEPQPSRKGTPGLRSLSDGSNNDQYGLNVAGDQSPSIFTCLKNTYKQANVFLDISRNIKRSRSKNASDTDSTETCRTIAKFYGVLLKKMALGASDHYQTQEIKDPWSEYSEKNRVTFTDDVLKNHRLTKLLPGLKSSSRDRMLTISKEISSLSTSLPAGIFVKVAESRADVMKVLIVGVEGSPYAGGIFT
jgi:hypothetical protein